MPGGFLIPEFRMEGLTVSIQKRRKPDFYRTGQNILIQGMQEDVVHETVSGECDEKEKFISEQPKDSDGHTDVLLDGRHEHFYRFGRYHYTDNSPNREAKGHQRLDPYVTRQHRRRCVFRERKRL